MIGQTALVRSVEDDTAAAGGVAAVAMVAAPALKYSNQ